MIRKKDLFYIFKSRSFFIAISLMHVLSYHEVGLFIDMYGVYFPFYIAGMVAFMAKELYSGAFGTTILNYKQSQSWHEC